MSVIKYFGRTTDFKGKTLWEIVGNLKNYGIGRIVTRSRFERYEEPCYMKILKVEALPNEQVRKVKVTVEKTFRGQTYPKPIVLLSSSYKADYRLIPKVEEAEYCKVTSKIQEKILPTTIEFPPLLKEFIAEETGEKNPVMKVHFKGSAKRLCRLAKDGETPTINLGMGIGNPISPKIYANCQ